MPTDRATVRRRRFSKNFNADLIFWFFFIKKKEQRAEDYLYSSAKNYAGEQGLLTVTILEGIHGDGGWKSGGWPTGGSSSGKWQKGGWNTMK